MIFESIIANSLEKLRDSVNDTILQLRSSECVMHEWNCTNTEFYINDFGHTGYRAWVSTGSEELVAGSRLLELALDQRGYRNVKVMEE